MCFFIWHRICTGMIEGTWKVIEYLCDSIVFKHRLVDSILVIHATCTYKQVATVGRIIKIYLPSTPSLTRAKKNMIDDIFSSFTCPLVKKLLIIQFCIIQFCKI